MIYVVERTEGQYEDRFSLPVAAFRSKEDAEAYCEEENKYYDDLEKKYIILTDEGSAFKYDALNDKAFDTYLKDVAPDLHEAYEELDKCQYNEDDFDWSLFDDYQSQFDNDEKLKMKYYEKIGLTDEEVINMGIIDEYRELYDGIPYFNVSREIELK